jgi:hypothetical protein
MHYIPRYHVSEFRNVNAVQLLGAFRARNQVKQSRRSGTAKCIFLLKDLMIFLNNLISVFI